MQVKKITLTPKKLAIVGDRDNKYNWYLDKDTKATIWFTNGKKHTLNLSKGYRFNAHSVPFIVRLLFPQVQGPDLACSLVHDGLIDQEMTSRLSRETIDNVYEFMMNMPEYKTNDFRSKWMPWAVKWNGYLQHTMWGDYRGEPKKETIISVNITEK